MTDLVRQGIIFILIGPAGSGKTTFCARLIGEFAPSLRYAVSATSRKPRQGEVSGVNYIFLNRDEFEQRVRQGDFFEWEEIHGNLYGTLRHTLEEGINQGCDLLYQIDIRGALNFKRSFPKNTVVMFLVPPSFEVMRSRLVARGGADSAELERRFATARTEYETLQSLAESSGDVDYFIVNKDIEATYEQVRAVVISERVRFSRIDRNSIADCCKIG